MKAIGPDRLKASGERIKTLRLALGLRATDMCAVIGCTAQDYSNWEHGVCQPSLEHAFKFFDLWGVPLEYIYRGDMAKGDADNMPHKLFMSLGQDNRKKVRA